MPSLIDLLSAISQPLDYDHYASVTISYITADSRAVVPGTLFIALKGEKTDGAQFIAQAKQNGAVAVLCEHGTIFDESGLTVLRARNARRAQAQIAAAFYPKQPTHIAAVTGTDGKTSTADFYRQFWNLMGTKSASIGTLGVINGAGGNLYPGALTTPDPIALHRMLQEIAQAGYTHVCMEASSHGLHQHRLDGAALEAAAFTNIARDHLDYHKTEEDYFTAKSRLFSELLPEGKTAVLNADDAKFAALKTICEQRNHRIIGFGKNGEQLKIKDLQPLPHGQRASLEIFGKPYSLDIPLVGAFQVMNILAALGLVIGSDGDLENALAVIPKLQGVPGRLEQVATLKNGAAIFIDYAHTPAALANILRTLRPHTAQKLHVVFGCGGDRDAGKRPQMGRIASELADVAIVTDDNPRSENAASIRAAIMAASPRALEVADRRQAIYVAISGLGTGDILVIAGKGHEKTQIIGKESLPFDDAEVARDTVRELGL